MSPASLPTPRRQWQNLPGAEPQWLAAKKHLIEQRYRCRLHQMAVRRDDGGLQRSANYGAGDADSSQLQTASTSLIVNQQPGAHPWMDDSNIPVLPRDIIGHSVNIPS